MTKIVPIKKNGYSGSKESIKMLISFLVTISEVKQ